MNFKNAIPELVDNDKIISDENGKAKSYNMFFKSVLTKESDHLSGFNLNVKSSIELVSFLTDKIKKEAG